MKNVQHLEYRILDLVEWQRNPVVSTRLQVYLTTDDAQENMLGNLLAVYDSDTESEGEETPQQPPRTAQNAQTRRDALKNKMHERMNHAMRGTGK